VVARNRFAAPNSNGLYFVTGHDLSR